MDRKVFQERFDCASSVIQHDMKIKSELKTMDNKPLDIGAGTRNIVIVMEELAELQQQLSKFLRGKEDHLGLVEECADVLIAIDYVKLICGVTDEEINKAMNVKIDRLLRTKGVYE